MNNEIRDFVWQKENCLQALGQSFYVWINGLGIHDMSTTSKVFITMQIIMYLNQETNV